MCINIFLDKIFYPYLFNFELNVYAKHDLFVVGQRLATEKKLLEEEQENYVEMVATED